MRSLARSAEVVSTRNLLVDSCCKKAYRQRFVWDGILDFFETRSKRYFEGDGAAFLVGHFGPKKSSANHALLETGEKAGLTS